MRRTVHAPTGIHQTLFTDFTEILRKYEHLSKPEILAIASQIVGMLIALQDQRTMTSEIAMAIVTENLQMGNKRILDELASKSEGSA